jgi:hypothetical protein
LAATEPIADADADLGGAEHSYVAEALVRKSRTDS